MSSLSGTRLPEPTDWEDFERKSCVLFRCVLNDPNTQQNGRQGQPQHGVDVYGYRDEDAQRLVGVQCKKKYRDEVKESELEEEVEKAQKFEPAITEFILVTTAPRDQKIQTTARQITKRLAVTDRPIRVYVWGWEDICERAGEHDEAYQAFDPTYEPFSKRGFDELNAKQDENTRLLQEIREVIERRPNAGSLVNVDKARRDDTEIFGQVKAFDAIASSGDARVALQQLTKLREEKWADANEAERYRIHASIASAHHQLGEGAKAAEHLFLAVEAFPGHEKAQLAKAKAELLRGEFEEALRLSEGLLDDATLREEAAGIVVQCRYFTGRQEAALDGVAEELKYTSHVLMAQVIGTRSINDPNWRCFASEAYRADPDNDYLQWFAADALLHEVLSNHPDLQTRDQLTGAQVEKLREALGLYDALLNRPESKEFVESSLANNASLAARLVGEEDKAAKILERGLSGAPQETHLLLQRAALHRNSNEFSQVLELLPDDIQSLEGQVLRAECQAASGEPVKALATLDGLEGQELTNSLRMSALATRARSLCDTGAGTEAKRLVDREYASAPEDPMRLALRLKVYRSIDGDDVGGSILRSDVAKIGKDSDLGGVLELCHEARQLNCDDLVVDLLRGRVNTEHYNDALLWLISACAQANFSKAAQDLFDTMSESAAADPRIMRARAIFALQIGDPDTEKLVSQAIRSNPRELDLLLLKADLLSNSGRQSDVQRLIKDIEPNNVEGTPVEVMALAYHFTRNGRANDGLTLAYQTLIRNWSEPSVHLRYHGVILLNREIGKVLPFLSEVTNNCVTTLVNSESETQVYRIEPQVSAAFGAEHIDPASELALDLAGKKVGDEILLPKGMDAEGWKITEIKHPALDAFHRSMNDFNRRFPRSRGLMQFKVDLEDQEPFAEIKAVLKASADRNERALDHYQKNLFPFLFVSSLIGRDPIEAWLGMLDYGRTFKTSFGAADESTAVHQGLGRRERTGCVVDPITLTLIRRLELKDAVEQVCGPLFTTQSVIDVFVRREVELSGDQSDRMGAIAYHEGQLVRTELTADEIRQAYELRHEELVWIRDNVQILPALPADDLSQEQRSIVALVDGFAWEPVAAAQGNDLLLLSEDLGLRAWAGSSLGVLSSWLQPVLAMAKAEQKLEEAQYHYAVTSIALGGHRHVSLSPEDIFYQFKMDGLEVSGNLKRLVDTTTEPNADLPSNIGVLANAIGKTIAKNVNSRAVCRLTSLVLSSLMRGRSEKQVQLVDTLLKKVPDCPDWLREHGLRWLVGHSIGMPYFQELLDHQKSIQSR